MTVDSRYAIAQYNEDGEVFYRFFTESIGDEAMQVWSVAPDGTRMQLASNQYSIEYDLSQTPIFKGGKITLVTPLDDGYKLSVERKTPIVNDLTLTSLTPFPSERFEYMMDKICFIQQEIEGSYCDCRDSGGDIPVPPNVCKVYDCDAIQVVVDKYAADYWPLMEKNSKAGPFTGKSLVPASTWFNPQGSNEDHYEWDGTPGLGIYPGQFWTNTSTWASLPLGISGDLETTALASTDFNPCVDPLSPEGMWANDGSSQTWNLWHWKRNSEDFSYSTSDSGRRYGRMSHNFSGIFYRFNENSSIIALAACNESYVSQGGSRSSNSFDVLVTRYNSSVGGYTAGDLVIRTTGEELAVLSGTPGGNNNTPVFISVVLVFDYDNRIHTRNQAKDDNGRAAFDVTIPYTGYYRVTDADQTFDESSDFSGIGTFGVTFGEAASAGDPDYVLPVSNYYNIQERWYAFGFGPSFGVHSLVNWQQLTPVDSIQEYLDAWNQAKDSYVDPDPQCIPRCKVYACDAYNGAGGALRVVADHVWPMDDTSGRTQDVKGSLDMTSTKGSGGTFEQGTLYATCEGEGDSTSFAGGNGFYDETSNSINNIQSITGGMGFIIQSENSTEGMVVFLEHRRDRRSGIEVFTNGTDLRCRLEGGNNGGTVDHTFSGILSGAGTADNVALRWNWSGNDCTLDVYIDFVLVDSHVYNLAGVFSINGPGMTFGTYRSDGSNASVIKIQDAWYKDSEVTDQNIADLKAGWDQNQIGYVDPDPTCWPNIENQ